MVSRVPAQEGTNDRRQDSADVDLGVVWSTGRDALAHGRDLARIQAWRIGERTRSLVLKLLAACIGAGVLIAVAVTAAVWATVALLEGLSGLVGGGLAGFALATGAFLGATLLLVAVGKSLAARARVGRWRARLSGGEQGDDGRQRVQGREEVALDELEAETVDALRRDGARLAEQGRRLWRAHPLASIGVGAATGFAVTRLVLAAPRPWRRGVVSAIRLARSTALALGAGALREALQRDAKDAGANGTPDDRARARAR